MPKFLHEGKEYFVNIEYSYSKERLLEMVNETLSLNKKPKLGENDPQFTGELCEKMVAVLSYTDEDNERDTLEELDRLILKYLKKSKKQ